MSTNDDQDWLDALAGRAGGASSSLGKAEGEMLRQAVQLSRGAVRAAQGAHVPSADSTREAALIARAAREGLIASARGARSRVRAAWRPMLAAAALGALAFGIGWQLRGPTGEGIVRDAQQEPVRLESPQPAQLQRQILGELRAAGVDATGYESLGVYGVDADLPQPLSADVRRVLESRGVAVPADGVLRIEIRVSR